MSVNIVPTQQPSTFLQRLTGTEPRTVVRESSVTTISSDPGGRFDLKAGLRNGVIGAAVAGALGGASLLGKVALPLIGKVGSVAGLAKLAGIGGALGLATAALPMVASHARRSPATKAALTGVAIGAAAGAVLPLMPIPIGAAIGAGVGLLVHHRRTHPVPHHAHYPGYRAYPGFAPYGMDGGPVPHGMVPVTPNFGGHVPGAMNPYGFGGYPPVGYGASMVGHGGYGGYGMSLPMQGGAQAQPTGLVPTGALPAAVAAQALPQAPRPAAAPTRAPRFPKAKTYKDPLGNVRQVGTGKLLKASGREPARIPVAPAATAGAVAGVAGMQQGGYGFSSPVAAQSMVPTAALPAMPTA